MAKTLNFIYFGRFEEEKGFDLILKLFRKLFFDNERHIGKVRFFIFGDGKLKNEFLRDFGGVDAIFEDDLSRLNKGEYKSINYFGWQNKTMINDLLSKSDFALMPSRFIETFGLSAVEACEKGVNVIGFAKGALTQFILPELDITRWDGKDEFEKLYNLIINLNKNFDSTKIKRISSKSKEIAQNYTQDIWLENFQELFKGKKILMISDYDQNIGGIESYIYKVRDLLVKKGINVQIVGRKGINNKIGKTEKILGLPMVVGNIPMALKIKKSIEEFKPDLIWFHSVSRFIGWLGIAMSGNSKTEKWMMYHDLGYFCAYPSKLYNTSNFENKINLIDFIKSANTKNPIKIIACCAKFISNYLIYKMLKKYITKHLVPSEFMVNIVKKQYDIGPGKIVVLPHFYK